MELCNAFIIKYFNVKAEIVIIPSPGFDYIGNANTYLLHAANHFMFLSHFIFFIYTSMVCFFM